MSPVRFSLEKSSLAVGNTPGIGPGVFFLWFFVAGLCRRAQKNSKKDIVVVISSYTSLPGRGSWELIDEDS
jgi:hypothetical protein